MDDWKHDHLGNQIIILSNQVKHYLHQAAEVEGISGSQSRILHYISEFSKKTEVRILLSAPVYRHPDVTGDGEERTYQALQRCQRCTPEETGTDRSRAGTRSTDTYTCDADGTAAERKLNRGRNHTVFINYR